MYMPSPAVTTYTYAFYHEVTDIWSPDSKMHFWAPKGLFYMQHDAVIDRSYTYFRRMREKDGEEV